MYSQLSSSVILYIRVWRFNTSYHILRMRWTTWWKVSINQTYRKWTRSCFDIFKQSFFFRILIRINTTVYFRSGFFRVINEITKYATDYSNKSVTSKFLQRQFIFSRISAKRYRRAKLASVIFSNILNLRTLSVGTWNSMARMIICN